MKKIIPAIAMTLLGASLLGTSTYAWFSANTKATADGLQIKAQAASSLLVSNSETGTFGAKTTLTDEFSSSKTEFQVGDPVTPGCYQTGAESTTAIDFKKLNEASKASVISDGTCTNPVYVAATNADYIKSQVWVLYAGKDTSPTVDVHANLEITQKLDGIWDAIHVALYEKGANTKAGATPVADFVFTEDTDGVEPNLGIYSQTVNFGVVSETKKGFDVYAWVEGTDAACYNANALNGDLYAISLTFDLHH